MLGSKHDVTDKYIQYRGDGKIYVEYWLWLFHVISLVIGTSVFLLTLIYAIISDMVFKNRT